MDKPRWIMWTGGSSTVLHSPPDLRTTTRTACGTSAQLVGSYGATLPPGKYTHCVLCRRQFGE